MTDRTEVEHVLQRLYAARVGSDLQALCALFTPDARFRIAGASDGKPIAILAHGSAEIRSWLAVLVKTFRINEHEIASLLIEGPRAAVHWHARIHSRITGVIVPTDFADLVEVRSGLIASYVEFFVPS